MNIIPFLAKYIVYYIELTNKVNIFCVFSQIFKQILHFYVVKQENGLWT